MINLVTSPVQFDAEKHIYEINGKRLSGVTALIKKKVCPNMYDDVPQSVLDAAKARGNAVHGAIELFIKYGVQTDSTAFKSFLTETKISKALAKPIYSEYIVSDEKQYASGIDIISEAGKDSVYLIDTKTTSSKNIEYVTWQLSVYKYFFEMQNPGIKVAGIFLLWIHQDEHTCQELTPHTKDEVMSLLYDDDYIPVSAAGTEMSVSLDIQNQVKQYKMAMEEAKKQYDALSKGLEKLMEERGVKKFDGRIISITKKADSVRRTFDAKAFEKEYPEMYAKYVKESKTKGGILIKIKE